MVRKLKNIFHLIKAVISNIIYGFPSKRIKVVGITGTDGKTTTSHLIYHILKSCGKKTSVISSIYANIAGEKFDTGFHVTTPDTFQTQKYISSAVNHGDEYFILETTAHGLDQNRVWGIDYLVSVLTNITHEHIKSISGYDYFGSYDNYLKSKSLMMRSSKKIILNKDDQSYQKILKTLKKHNLSSSILTYSLNNKADFIWSESIKTELIGDYNKYNILAAISVASILGIEKDQILKAVSTFKLPKGRFEIIQKNDFKIVIDFAHTINGLNQVLKTVRRHLIKGNGKIIHVFGCAGLRDTAKRPEMGKISAKYSNLIILTEEDFRTEDLNKICAQIGSGIKEMGKKYMVIENRSQAIKKAVSLSKKDDVIVITGKGHEQSLCRGNKECPWDERKAVQHAILEQIKH